MISIQRKQTVQLNKYCFYLNQLEDEKCLELVNNRKGIIVHQDNARSYIILVTR